MEALSPLGYLLAGLAISWLVTRWLRPRHRYPPGPRGLPLVGSVFDVPTKDGWLVFRDWARKYDSDIVHVAALGKHICVLNSAAAAKELFEGRPHIYSDKENSVMLEELSGWWRSWVQLPYGARWREHRRRFHQHFRPLAVPQYHNQQTIGARRLLALLLDAPEGFSRHVRYAAGSVILDVVYAFDARPGDARIELVEKAVQTSEKLVHAGVYLVDIFPILKHVPAWFPGAGFKREAAGYKKLVDAMYHVPYDQYKAAMRDGTADPCFLGSLLSDVDLAAPKVDEDMYINLAGTTYAAGSDTTITALNVFVLAMILYPDVQRAAQAELDRVVGRAWLPEIADRDALPYVAALVQEVLRWHPPLPLTLPHRATTADTYAGYDIPRDCVVLANAWAILHDPTTYPDPHTFDPARFLHADGTPNAVPLPSAVFGVGRRACPGRYFAADMLFVFVAHLLAAFAIERVEGEEVREEFEPYAISPPKPFRARFTPRYGGVEELVRAVADV
ncbi:cytochrome P450 [Phanerochaete sordida]|uniref:Cytochrome P450 n=1 Tax=Phanerochaete sordida TaxID=48140 RepID=A0A9P3GJT5_9APHY|nr:cytochrome P450 [Phanerochaete sordida]